MADSRHADVQQRAGTHATHGDRHTAPGVAVAAGLRAIRFGPHDEWSLRRAWQAARHLRPAEVAQRGDDVLHRCRVLETDRQAHRMPIEDGNAVGVRAEHDVGVHTATIHHTPQHLAQLLRELLLLARDVGHDVVQNIERGHAGIPRAGDRLHRRHKDLANAKRRVQRLERQRHARDRAVRTGDDEAGPAAPGALRFDKCHVIGVDLRDEQRHVGHGAVRRSIRADGVPRSRELRLDLVRHIRWQRRKDQLRGQIRLQRLHHHLVHNGRWIAGNHPLADIGVPFSRAPLRRRQRRHLEPRMSRQQLNKPLSHRPRRAQNANRNFTTYH